MRLNFLAFFSAIIFFSHSVLAVQAIYSYVPNASVVGKGILSYAFWDIYEATLFAPMGKWDPEKPFALSIEYYHSINGRDIADKSVQEMRRQGFTDEVKLAAWNAQMKAIFPDVSKGTVLSAVYSPGKQTSFYKGNERIGIIKGDDFAKLFFGIWLDNATSEPELRRSLLGLL